MTNVEVHSTVTRHERGAIQNSRLRHSYRGDAKEFARQRNKQRTTQSTAINHRADNSTYLRARQRGQHIKSDTSVDVTGQVINTGVRGRPKFQYPKTPFT